MAVYKGSQGLVKLGGVTVAEVTAFTLTETGEVIETSNLGSTARTYVSGMSGFEGTIECHWDPTDTTGQGALSILANPTLDLYPEGDTTGDHYASGSSIITAISVSNPDNNSLVSCSFTFTGTGALTWANVT